jgi:hypothetical protein
MTRKRAKFDVCSEYLGLQRKWKLIQTVKADISAKGPDRAEEGQAFALGLCAEPQPALSQLTD